MIVTLMVFASCRRDEVDPVEPQPPDTAASTTDTGTPPIPPTSESATTAETGTEPEEESYLALSAGDKLTCAVSSAGEAVCVGSTPWSLPPAPQGPFVAIAANWDTSCAIRETGEIACWGCDWLSDLCNAPTGNEWIAIDGADSWFCALDAAGRLRCWGLNYGWNASPDQTYSAFAVGATGPVGVRTEDGGLDKAGEGGDLPVPVTEVGAGRSAVCGVSAADGSTVCQWLEAPAPPSTGLAELDGYDRNFCWLDDEGHVGCSLRGPDAARDGFDPATEVFVRLSTGFNHACGVTADGRGFCWPRDGRPETSGIPERP